MPKEIIFCLMFGCLGFLMALFVSRTVNIAFIILLGWVLFKVFEKYGMKPDWPMLERTYQLIIGLGESLIELMAHLIKVASAWGMILFLLGGITGIILNRRRKATA